MKKLGLLAALLLVFTTVACDDNGSSNPDGSSDRLAADAKDAGDAAKPNDAGADHVADVLSSEPTADAVSDHTDASTVDAVDAPGADVPRDLAADLAQTDVPRDLAPVDVPREVSPEVSPGDAGVDGPADGPVTDGPTEAPAPTYVVGGTITGLSGSGLVLQNNAGDNLTVTAPATMFAFATRVSQGGAYAVTVLTQPSTPSQTCVVTAGTGTASANVATVSIACTTRTFTVGGTVTGLTGTGLVLRNGAENLPVAANAASFVFTTSVASGATYAVTVGTQPSSQSCVVGAGTGTVGAGNVTTVTVTCTNLYTVGGTIGGLTATGLVLRNNGGDDRTVAANATTFTFATGLASAAAYAVTVQAQPLGLICAVTGGTGTIATSNVTSVIVSCMGGTAAVGFSAETALALYGGSGPAPTDGGAPDPTFDEPCPLALGQVLIGFAGRAGGHIDRIQPVCGTVTVAVDRTMTPAATVTIAPGSMLPVLGNTDATAGTDFTGNLLCPTNEVVTGLVGTANADGALTDGGAPALADVDTLQVICSSLGANAGLTGLTTTIDTTPRFPAGSGDDMGSPFTESCAANQVATRTFGVAGTSTGSALDRIGVGCRSITLTAP